MKFRIKLEENSKVSWRLVERTDSGLWTPDPTLAGVFDEEQMRKIFLELNLNPYARPHWCYSTVEVKDE